jgi:hypothetical protein
MSTNRDTKMVIAIRIDIDNPFGMATRFRRLLNRISINYGVVPKLTQLGYLNNSIKLLSRLASSDICGTWFFRTVSAPTRGLLHNFIDFNQDLGLHAEQTGSLESFSKEVRTWEKKCGRRPTGFTKHGSGELKLSRRHDSTYAPARLLEYGRKTGFTYFLGNNHQYQDAISEHDGIIYAPSVFWLDRTTLYGESFSLDSIIETSFSIPLIVLIHPVWYAQRKEVSDGLERLLDKCEFSTIEDVLQTGLKHQSN